MSYLELKLSNNYEELSKYYYIFNMLSSEVFKIIENEVSPLGIIDNAIFPFLIPRSKEDDILIRCMFKYRDPFSKVTRFQTRGLPVRDVDKLEWKDCDRVILEFSTEFYRNIKVMERVDEYNKVVDYFLELKRQTNIEDLRVRQVLKERDGWIDPDDITSTKEACQYLLDKLMKIGESKNVK